MTTDEAVRALRQGPAATRKAQDLYVISLHPGTPGESAKPRLLLGWSLVSELFCSALTGLERRCGGASARRAHPNPQLDSI